MIAGARGLPISTDRPIVAASLERFEEEILSHGCGAAVVLGAFDADPGCALAAAYAAILHLFRGTADGVAAARGILAGVPADPTATPRELAMLEAARAWSQGADRRAVGALGELLRHAPTDLFAAKLRGYLQLARGDAPGLLATSRAARDHSRGDARAWGLYAFALDQVGDPFGAERAAHAALARGPDPWAHHALAHAYEHTGRFGDGADWMARHAAAWDGCSSFMYTHNWWHAALLRLGAGDPDCARGLLHARVWAKRRDHGQDQINAISLAARLERAGVEMAPMWADVAAHVAPRRHEAVDPFLDMHAAYALGRSGRARDLAELVAAVADKAAGSMSRRRQVAREAVAGIGAFALGAVSEAGRRLGPIAGELRLLGGSTVQRALWSGIAADAARGLGPDGACVPVSVAA